MERNVSLIQKVVGILKRTPAKPTTVTKPKSKTPVKSGLKTAKKATKKMTKPDRR